MYERSIYSFPKIKATSLDLYGHGQGTECVKNNVSMPSRLPVTSKEHAFEGVTAKAARRQGRHSVSGSSGPCLVVREHQSTKKPPRIFKAVNLIPSTDTRDLLVKGCWKYLKIQTCHVAYGKYPSEHLELFTCRH